MRPGGPEPDERRPGGPAQRRVRERGPVRLHGSAERREGRDRDRREGRRGDADGRRSPPADEPPRAEGERHDPGAADEPSRELEERAQRRLAPQAVADLEQDGDPAVRRVPEQVGKEEEHGHGAAEPRPGRPELGAQLGVEEDEQHERRREQRGGVLREEREPHGDAGRDPAAPPRPAHEPGGGAVGRLHRRVGERQPAREREDGGGGGEQRGDGRGAPVPGELARHERREDHRQRAAAEEEDPDAELAGDERRGGADEPRHHGRVIEVPGRRAARPRPVVGLVGVEVEAEEEKQPQRRSAGGDGPDRPELPAARLHGGASYMVAARIALARAAETP
jgi:hypothetical protein